MTYANISWFKHGVQYDAKFTGFKVYKQGKHRVWNKITIFAYDTDHKEVCRQVAIEAAKYGYVDVTVDKIVRVGV